MEKDRGIVVIAKCPGCGRNIREPEDEQGEHGCTCGYYEKEDYVCEECGTPMPDYVPELCCSGRDCGCKGLPIEPCICDKCWDRLGKEGKL